ncbi:MAG: efflux RND transporter periplasmic adaptor subunit [Parvularculales bacterium]
MKRSYIAAALIALVAAGWLLSGLMTSDDDKANSSPNPQGFDVQTTPKGDKDVFLVKGRIITAQPFVSTITLQGQTEAIRKVSVRSETTGTIKTIPVAKGDFVSAGDLLCELNLEARMARLDEARALKRQRELEYNAAVSLVERGHMSPNRVAAVKAAFDGAQAAVAQHEVEVEKTKIVAPFEGIVDELPLEVRDYVQVGQPCATIVDSQPILAVAMASENEVSHIAQNSPGIAHFPDGTEATGHIRFIAVSADPATRSFRTELEIPNDNGGLRDGITVEVKIPAHDVMAHHISPSALVLNDNGQVGVRLIDGNNRVTFAPVTVLSGGNEGVWITGLPQEATLITVGQEFVVEGQNVQITLEEG